jgi:hypothetical protein
LKCRFPAKKIKGYGININSGVANKKPSPTRPSDSRGRFQSTPPPQLEHIVVAQVLVHVQRQRRHSLLQRRRVLSRTFRKLAAGDYFGFGSLVVGGGRALPNETGAEEGDDLRWHAHHGSRRRNSSLGAAEGTSGRRGTKRTDADGGQRHRGLVLLAMLRVRIQRRWLGLPSFRRGAIVITVSKPNILMCHLYLETMSTTGIVNEEEVRTYHIVLPLQSYAHSLQTNFKDRSAPGCRMIQRNHERMHWAGTQGGRSRAILRNVL